MNITQQNTNWTKRSGILIIGICLSAILLQHLVQPYRGTWVYQYGNLTSFFTFFGGILASLINTIFLLSKHKSDLKTNWIWILLSAVPLMYFTAMITM